MYCGMEDTGKQHQKYFIFSVVEQQYAMGTCLYVY
jgi:hypothetical protein